MAVTLIHPGATVPVLQESPAAAGTVTRDIAIQTDAALFGLVVHSASAAINVNIYYVVDGQQSLLLSFPAVSLPTAGPLLRRTPSTTGTLRIVATWAGACSFEVHVRAIMGGTSDTKILGAAGWEVTQVTVGTAAMLLIPAAFDDRAGLVIKNWSGTQIVYLAESLASATASTGYPLAPKDALAMDIAAGTEVYAISSAAGADLRIVEAGG